MIFLVSLNWVINHHHTDLTAVSSRITTESQILLKKWSGLKI